MTFLHPPLSEFDYTYLKSTLSNYPKFRNKISQLLKKQEIIRVKKGLYILGKGNSETGYIKETLANLIYGPSYISLQYALSYYNLIPERVEAVTSITTKRDKKFSTPVGLFTYRYLASAKYWIGVNQIRFDAKHCVMIATKEKAIVDMLTLEAPRFDKIEQILEYLTQDLRIEIKEIKKLNKDFLLEIARICKTKNVELFLKYLNKI